MNDRIFWTIIGVIIPFIGTTAGSGVVFFFRNNVSQKLQKIFNGFAARSYVCCINLVTYNSSNRNGKESR